MKETKHRTWNELLALLVILLFAYIIWQHDKQPAAQPVIIQQPSQLDPAPLLLDQPPVPSAGMVEVEVVAPSATQQLPSVEVAQPTQTPVYVFLKESPMSEALAAGEWPRPITPQQYDQCVADPDVNPACADYLEVNR